MEKNQTLYSQLITCYNHEKYIADALQSALTQTYERMELILCDDCSKDRSWEIIQSYMPKLSERFERTVVFRNPENLGLTASLNKMIPEAQGYIVSLLSGDDMMAVNYVTDIMDASAGHPEASVFVTDGYPVEEKTRYAEIDTSVLIPFHSKKPDFNKDTLFERLYWHNCVFAPGASVRRDVYDKYGLYDPDICIEDLEYWLRISRTKETEFFYIDKQDVFYRKNPESVSSEEKNERFIARSLTFLEASEKIVEKYGPYVGEEEYIRRKWAFLLDERTFYKMNLPLKEKEMLKVKLRPFIKKNWHFLGWKQLVRYYHMYINAIRNYLKNR